MTSSLPDFSSGASAASAADASSLAALFPGAATSTATGAASGQTPEFDALIGASAGAATPAVASAPCVAEAPTGIVSRASTPTLLLASLGLSMASEAGAADATGTVAALTPGVETVAAGEPREVTRTMLEEAAAFVTSLLQTLMPAAQPPELSAVAYQRAAETVAVTGQPAGVPASVIPAHAAAAAQAGLVSTPTGTATAQADAAGSQLFTLAADGAIELKLDLAQLKPEEAVEVSAELQLEGEASVRLEATTASAGMVSPAVSAPSQGREIFAGKFAALKTGQDTPVSPGERNFVLSGDKQVKSESAGAGISVAKTDSSMPSVPTKEINPARSPEATPGLSPRADFLASAPLAERTAVPEATPAELNFAGRAVDTVTNIVDTQFSARMQKAGSVQLHLQFGGEDLSVRVELNRDGDVQTDFRTDSASLRNALSREWQIVAAQAPEQMRRFLEPVFAPNTPPASSGSSDTPSFSSRQQQQAQQEQSSRQSWGEQGSPFSRRSQLSDSFIPEPAASRAPAFLPTSSRLSALA